MNATKIKTRFAPSPTGSLHVGGARTALFNYAVARQLGGTFLLRIEDTDRERHQEQAVPKIIEDLRWLGIEWDEGIEVGGPNGPYRQSERLEIYRDYVRKLIDNGKAYYAFETEQELDAMRKQAEAVKTSFRYVRPSRLPDAADVARARAEGRPVVVRFMNPGQDVTIHDDAFGDVTVPAGEQDDFIILKADDYPTYHLANVIDDALMGITHIMRGQEFLGQSWRHAVLRKAMGFAEPSYCHLPLIMDMQGRKLSKRDGDVEVDSFRRAGYLPETMINFIALLGWNPGSDVEKFSLAELVKMFSTERVSKTNAKFDRQKLIAFNTDAIAAASPTRHREAFKDYLTRNEIKTFPICDEVMLDRILAACKGIRTFADVIVKCGVLFDADDSYSFDEKAVEKNLRKDDGAGLAVLAQIKTTLASLEDWSVEAIEKAVNDFAVAKNLGMGKVAQPLRVAVTGNTVSPGISDTLLFLGKGKTIARIDRCLAACKK